MKNKILKYSLAILLLLLSLYAIYAYNRFAFLIKTNLNPGGVDNDPLSYSYYLNPVSLMYVFTMFFSLIYIWTNKKTYMYLNIVLSINALLFVLSYQPEFSQVSSFTGEVIHILLVNAFLILLSILNVVINKIIAGKSFVLNKNENVVFLVSSVLLCFSGFYLYSWSFPSSAASLKDYPFFLASIPIIIAVITLISVLNFIINRKEIIIKVKHNKVETFILLSLLYLYLFNIALPIYPQITIFFEAFIIATLLLVYQIDIYVSGTKRNNFVFTLSTLFLGLMLIVKTITFSYFASQDFNISGGSPNEGLQAILLQVVIYSLALLEIASEVFVLAYCFKEINKNKEVAQLNGNHNLSIFGVFLFLCYFSSLLFYLGVGIESTYSIYAPFMHLWNPHLSLVDITSIHMKLFYILTQPSFAILLTLLIESLVLFLINKRLKKNSLIDNNHTTS